MFIADLISQITEETFNCFPEGDHASSNFAAWRQAFQIAIVHTYTTFARTYPHWTSFFFNMSFLRPHVLPQLGRWLQMGTPPDPAILLTAWKAYSSIRHEIDKRRVAEFSKAASSLLYWLEAELQSQNIFPPLVDSSNAEHSGRSGSAKSVKTKTTAMEYALSEASKYNIIVDQAQGLVIEDKVTVTNIFHTFFDGQFANLQEFYLAPDEVFERVRVDDFEGRAWLENDLDSFLNDPAHDRGVWLLVGEAGVGKTAFMAHLVRERGYLHFFAEQAPGDINLPRALQSLASQLISRFRLEPYVGRDTLPQTLYGYSDFLARLLRSASERLNVSERLVLVLDALDEAGTISGGNVLGLPRHLPKGVFLIISQRPKNVQLNVQPFPHHRLNIRANSLNNRQDMFTYLHRVAMTHAIGSQLYAQNYSQSYFAEELAQKSGGNWMYLRYVLDEIHRGLRIPLNLSKLPFGLVGYYAEYWGRWRDLPEWDTLYAPLLTTLAASFEPISLTKLILWSGIQVKPRIVLRLIRQEWSAFIYELEGDEHLYRPYHASLREFFACEVDPYQFSPGIEWFLQELRDWTRDAHQRIVTHFSSKCNGAWEQLTQDSYAHNYLCVHLRLAGEFEQLFELIDANDWRQGQMAIEPSGMAYLNDLEQAWMVAEKVNAAAVEQGKYAPLLSREIHCALATASLHSLARNMPTELLVALVETDWWTPPQALAAARQNIDLEVRSKALGSLSRYLPEVERCLVIQEALEGAWAVENVYRKPVALTELIPFLSDTEKHALLVEAVEAGRNLALTGHFNNSPRGNWFKTLAAYLPEYLLLQTLDIVQSIDIDYYRFDALGHIAPHLARVGRPETAIDIARTIPEGWLRSRTLLRIIQYLTGDAKLEITTEVLQSIRNLEKTDTRTRLLIHLLPFLPETEQPFVLEEALAAARTIQEQREKAELLAQLGPHLVEPDQLMVLKESLTEAISAGLSAERSYWRRDAIGLLAPLMSIDMLHETIMKIQEVQRPWWLAQALGQLAPYLPEDLLRMAISVAQKLEDTYSRADALIQLIPSLVSSGYPDEAVDMLWGLPERGLLVDQSPQREASGLIIIALIKKGYIQHALNVVHRIGDSHYREGTIANLIPELARLEKFNYVLDFFQSIESIPTRLKIMKTMSSCLDVQTLMYFIDYTRNLQYSTVQPEESLVISYTLESLRSEVLVEFACYLPAEDQYIVFREALDIAEEIPHNSQRAATITKIIPKLPDVLQYEAIIAVIAAVKSIGDESPLDPFDSDGIGPSSSQDSLLSELAPYLINDLIPKALEVAYTIRNERFRVQALRRMCKHFPSEVCQSVLLYVRSIEDIDARAMTLCALAERLPQPIRDEVVHEALSLARSIERDFSRTGSLRMLSYHVPEPLVSIVLREALEAAKLVKADQGYEHDIRYLVPRFAQHGDIEQALLLARSIETKEDKTHALSSLVPYVPSDLKDKVLFEAIETVRSIKRENEDSWGRTLAYFIPELVEMGYYNHALSLVDEMGTTGWGAEARVRIAQTMPSTTVLQTLPLVYVIEEWRRGTGLQALDSDLAHLTISVLYPVWKEMLHHLANRTRQDLLGDLQQLTKTISQLGGERGIVETIDAVRDVGQWLP